MTELRVTWQYGEKTILAKRCDISPQYFSDLLCGRRRTLPELGKTIEKNAADMGIHLSMVDMMFPHESSNPLLNAKPTTHPQLINRKS